MKKLFLVLLCFTLAFCFVGCKNTNNPDPTVIKESKPTQSVHIELKDEEGNLIVDNENIARIYARHKDDSIYLIEFKLTGNGKKQLAKVSEENIGKCIGVYIDNTLFAITEVVDVIDDGSYYLPDFSTEEEMMEIYNTFINGIDK